MTPEAKRCALGLLLIESENLRKNGFSGLLCMGVGPHTPSDCQETCPLVELAPGEFRVARTPCRLIPLNERGETVEELSRKQDIGYLEKQLLQWMERTAQRLQEELREEPRLDA